MVHANRAKNIETTTSGHLQVEDERVRLHLLNAAYGFRHVACLSHKLRSLYLLQQVRQTFHDCLRIIGDKNFHLLLLKNPLPRYRE